MKPGAARPSDRDVVVIGGGIVGGAVAHGLVKGGARVTVLDQGDVAFRASRGNFALVWVQSKGLGMPEYAHWSRRSALDWHEFADVLRDEGGIDVAHSRPGGFIPCLSEKELEGRIDAMHRLHNSLPQQDFQVEVLDHAETKRRLPDIGKDVVGSLYCPLDGHVNSLKLFRGLRAAGVRNGIDYRPQSAVDTITPLAGGGFRVQGPWGEIVGGKVVLAAGLGNARLGPMVGLDAPVRPSKGQIIVTEKVAPFLHYPLGTIRQTDEGGVLVGDSQEDKGFDTVVGQPVLSVMADRAVRTFPRLAGVNVVRTWSALRVMSADGFPMYDQSQTYPGAFLVTCHSGVTLAANHAMTIAPAILAGALPEMVACFSARRFNVPANA